MIVQTGEYPFTFLYATHDVSHVVKDHSDMGIITVDRDFTWNLLILPLCLHG